VSYYVGKDNVISQFVTIKDMLKNLKYVDVYWIKCRAFQYRHKKRKLCTHLLMILDFNPKNALTYKDSFHKSVKKEHEVLRVVRVWPNNVRVECTNIK
jgi:hypothetical protein